MQQQHFDAGPSSGGSGVRSSLGRFARLRQAGGGVGKQREVKDEWFIPYTAPAYPNAASPPDARASAHHAQGGIGESPGPAPRASHGLSAFWDSLSGGGSGSSSQGRMSDESIKRNEAYETNRAPQQRRFTKLPRSSDSSMDFHDDPPVNTSRSRLPSSTSVPTGLLAPPLLFSPSHRGMTLPSSGSVPDMRDHLQSSTGSLPLPGSRRVADGMRRWAAPTPCDTFVLPRPKLVAHTITPPISPERSAPECVSPSPSDAKVLQEGEARELEREEWARKARGRGRSLSFSSLGKSELANSSLINVRSRSKSQTRDRRTRSGSLSARWTAFDLNDSESEVAQSRQNSQRSSTGRVTDRSSRNVVSRSNNLESTQPARQRATSLMANMDDPFSSRQFSADHQRQVEPNPHGGVSKATGARELRFKQVAPVDVGGVVIITHPSAVTNLAKDDRQRTISLTDKPLPAVPPSVQRQPVSTIIPTSNEVGVAISSEPEILRKATPDDAAPCRPHSSSAHARTLLQREHQRSITKRAFQSPSYSSQPGTPLRALPATPLPCDPTTFQLGHRSSSSVGSASPSPTPSSRRQSTMEEAVGRGRAASAGQSSQPVELCLSSATGTHSAPDSTGDRAEILTAAGIVPELRSASEIVPLGARVIATPERTAINSSGHASSISSADWLSPHNSLPRTAIDASSPMTAGYSTDSSSPQTFGDDDYKNLFYHAPTRATETAASAPLPSSPLSAYRPSQVVGLGIGLEKDVDGDSVNSARDRHDSFDFSDGTVEIATPIHVSSLVDRQSSPRTPGPASLQGPSDPRSLLPPPRIVNQDDYASSIDDSPPLLGAYNDRHSGGLTPRSSDLTAGDETNVRYSQVHVGQAVHVPTPPLPSGELPRHVRRISMVPERGGGSQDDLQTLGLTPKSSLSNLQVPSNLSPQPETPRTSMYDPRRNSAAVSFIHEFPSPPRALAAVSMVRRDTFGTWDELANLSREPLPADEFDEELQPPRIDRMESTESTATSDSYATAREGFISSVDG